MKLNASEKAQVQKARNLADSANAILQDVLDSANNRLSEKENGDDDLEEQIQYIEDAKDALDTADSEMGNLL